MTVNYEALLGRGSSGGAPSVTPSFSGSSGGKFNIGGSRGGGNEALLGRSGNSWSQPAISAQIKQKQIDDLNAIGQGNSTMSYQDQIKAVNDAHNQGIINKNDTIKYINTAVDKNTPTPTPLNPVESVVKTLADPVVRMGNALGETISQFNGNNAKQQVVTDQQNKDTIASIQKAGQVIKNPSSTPQQKAQAQTSLHATMVNSNLNDQTNQAMLNARLDAVDPLKNAGAALDIVSNFIPGVDAFKAGKIGVDAAKVIAEGGAKVVAQNATKQIANHVISGAIAGGVGGGASALENGGSSTTANDLLTGAGRGALAGGVVAGAGGIIGKGIGKVVNKIGSKNISPVITESISSGGSGGSPTISERTPVPSTATTPLPFGDTAIHLPQQGIYARLTPEQTLHLKNEVANIPTSTQDNVHLSAITAPLQKTAKEVPISQIEASSPNARAALANVPTQPQLAIPKEGNSMLAKLPAALPGDIKAAPLAKQFIDSQYNALATKIKNAGDNLNQHDTALIPKIESKTNMTPQEASQRVNDVASKANDPKSFKAAVGVLKDFSDARLANDTALGREVGVRQNYLSRFYQSPTGDAAKALDHLRLSNGSNLPGYTKERSIATQEEANALASLKNSDGTPRFPQLQPLHNNVFEDAQHAIDLAKGDHGKQAMKIAFEQAHPGTQVGFGKVGFDTNSGKNYKELNISGAKGLTLPDHLAEVYNKRAQPKESINFGVKTKDGSIIPVRDNKVIQTLKETGGQLVDPTTGKSLHSNYVSRAVRSAVKNPLGAYDKLNAGIKYSVLGGGTFHAITTGGTVAGQQIARAVSHPLKVPGMIADNVKLAVGTLSKSAHETNMAAHEADGSLGFANMTGITLRSKDIAGDANVNWLEKAQHSDANPIKQIHDMVFDRQIPEAKMMIMKQAMQSKFKGIDFNHPTTEQVAYGRQMASSINGIGGINRAVEGLSPKTAKNLSRVLLATDFTEGKFRILSNAFTKTGPAGNIARQMVVGKSLVFAIPGLTALTVAGKLNWNNPDQVRQAIQDQILDPSIPLDEKGVPTKSNPGGNDQAIHFPSTFISELGKILKPAIDPLSSNKLKGAQDYITNRAAAGIGIGARLIQNKDFFGNSIYGQDAQGNTITPQQTALNIGNQVSPIPLVQGAKVAGGQSPQDAVLNTLGLRVSSNANSATGAHTQAVSDFYNTLNSAQTTKTKAVKQVNDLIKTGNVGQATRVANQYNQTLPSQLQEFKSKYADHYNPAWDQQFKTLQISVKPGAINGRIKANALAQKVISPNY